jgi:DNA-binding MarR family transcriptional regulator
MNYPHFDIHDIAPPASMADEELGSLLSRTAICLAALLQGPTATAGLNESRYNVLDALRRIPAGVCTQSRLAAGLLQSESNLSTLLERMRHDGLISRARSETDRRKSSIGLTRGGREALDRADLARNRETATILKVLDEGQHAAVRGALRLLLQRLEGALGIATRADNRVDQPAAMIAQHQTTRADSLITNGIPR